MYDPESTQVRRDATDAPRRTPRRNRAGVWALLAEAVCITVLHGAHLVYKASHAPDWYDSRTRLAGDGLGPVRDEVPTRPPYGAPGDQDRSATGALETC